jgi:hypothetical protein
MAAWAALAAALPLAAAAERLPPPERPCDCRSVRLQWLSWPARSEPTLLEAESRERLSGSFLLAEGPLSSLEQLMPAGAGAPAEAPVTVVSCDEGGYWAFIREAPARGEFELANARLLSLPLYVFVRDEGRPAASGMPKRIALVVPRDHRLENPDRLRDLLSAIVGGGRVELSDIGHPALLAEELAAPRAQSQFDAVALFGDEPSSVFEQFLDRYESLQPSLGPAALGPLLLLPESRPGPVHVLQESSSQLAHVLLEYPADSFYRFRLAEAGRTPDSRLNPAVGHLELVRGMGRASIPFLLTNARAQVARTALKPCCAEKLRQALGDAALLSAEGLPRLEPVPKAAGSAKRAAAERTALEHALLLYAFLASRSEAPGERSREETLRGLVLAAHLALRGEDAPSRRAQEAVQVRFKDHRQLLARLGVQPGGGDVRQSFSCDAVGLADEARRVLAEGRVSSAERLRRVRERLIRALAADTIPAVHKPGCGLTQVADYNPYLYLAQVSALQRTLTAQNLLPDDLHLAAVVPLVLAPAEEARLVDVGVGEVDAARQVNP